MKIKSLQLTIFGDLSLKVMFYYYCSNVICLVPILMKMVIMISLVHCREGIAINKAFCVFIRNHCGRAECLSVELIFAIMTFFKVLLWLHTGTKVTSDCFPDYWDAQIFRMQWAQAGHRIQLLPNDIICQKLIKTNMWNRCISPITVVAFLASQFPMENCFVSVLYFERSYSVCHCELILQSA